MSVTSRTSQISSIFTSWVELCRWHKAFLFSKTAGVTDWLPRAAVRNLGLLPLLAAEVVICGQLSYLSHPPMTGCGMGVIKTPSQCPFRSVYSILWAYTNSASSFSSTVWCTSILLENTFPVNAPKLSWVFSRLTFSIIPKANDQIFKNPKYKVSFLNFLKLVFKLKGFCRNTHSFHLTFKNS